MKTPNLELDLWVQNVAQPHIPINTSLLILDCLTQLRILDRDLTEPPGSPSAGDCYIPAAGATGDWADHENDVAMYIENGWVFRTPLDGWRAWVVDEEVEVRYEASSPPGWDVIS